MSAEPMALDEIARAWPAGVSAAPRRRARRASPPAADCTAAIAFEMIEATTSGCEASSGCGRRCRAAGELREHIAETTRAVLETAELVRAGRA